VTVRDPETGETRHPQDDPAALAAAADGLNEATLALEGIDYNALEERQLRTLLGAKANLEDVATEVRRHQHNRDAEGDRA
jgi:hypothetical protein